MSNKRKPGKRHNPLKRMQRQLNDIRMWCWQSDYDDDGTLFAHIEAKLHPFAPYKQLNKDYTPELIGYPFNWKICARALCQAGGKVWLETVEHVAYQKKINSIGEIYRQMEKEAVNAQQDRQIIDVGWIAQTFHKNPDFKQGWEYAHMGNASFERQMLHKLNRLESKAA
jgi:hypothetical protein